MVIGLLTGAYAEWLHVTNPTIVALSFLLVVVVVAAVSTIWVAVTTSVLAFVCFNFFFLPPVGTFTIADPENWVALFALLAVSIIASLLSLRARERTELVEQRKEAEIARRGAELKSALLASLGHDLKTPLTAVMVAASNLNASWLTSEQRREQTNIVLSELARLNRLLQDIVDMAKIETNAVSAEPEWVQPSEIVEAAAQQVERALAKHHLSVDLKADKTFVKVDPRLTSAALTHLLENAAQYSPAQSTITVHVKVVSDELQIAVRDQGPGIQAGDLEHVFERFYRSAAVRQHTIGTGMGLAITRGLLAAEGGRVWAENHPTGGALFTIAVPAETRPAAALEGQEV